MIWQLKYVWVYKQTSCVICGISSTDWNHVSQCLTFNSRELIFKRPIIRNLQETPCAYVCGSFFEQKILLSPGSVRGLCTYGCNAGSELSHAHGGHNFVMCDLTGRPSQSRATHTHMYLRASVLDETWSVGAPGQWWIREWSVADTGFIAVLPALRGRPQTNKHFPKPW